MSGSCSFVLFFFFFFFFFLEKKKGSTTTRFELARAEPIGFQNQLLNHSDTLSTHSLSGLTTETYEKGVRALGFTPPLTNKSSKWRPKKEPDAGLEPATSRLRACHSTD